MSTTTEVNSTETMAEQIRLGAELDAAMAAKMMDGVLEYFKDQVRQKLDAAGVKHGESEHARVTMSKGGGPSRVVDHDLWKEACKKKKVRLVRRKAMLKISKGELEDDFSKNEIEAMCVDGPPGTAACTIEQKDTLVTPIGVTDALKILQDYFKKGIITDKTFMKKKSNR